jgi:hypothetical protein
MVLLGMILIRIRWRHDLHPLGVATKAARTGNITPIVAVALDRPHAMTPRRSRTITTDSCRVATVAPNTVRTREMEMHKKILSMLAAAAVTAGLGTQASTAAPSRGGLPSPASFAGRVDNPWFPLKPGTVNVYNGVSDGKRARDVFTVTHRTKTIEGIRATVIDDRVYLNGRLSERTTDWYAQAKNGDVWYLGEDTATLDHSGKVKSTDGSFQAGVGGAQAGIFMPAHPRVGQTGRQEYYKSQAEDEFKVLDLNARVHTPAASSRHALMTQETTPLEPGVLDHKLYVRGIGTVREETMKGGVERFVLTSVRRG